MRQKRLLSQAADGLLSQALTCLLSCRIHQAMYYIAIYFLFFVHKESEEYTNITVLAKPS
jgi:hypothetical protein